MPIYPEAYLEFVELFNKEKYFEAHEVLEGEWHRQNRQNDFYKGLIQLAAVFVHIQKGNFAGARSLLHTSKKYLDPCFSHCEGMNLKTLVDRTELIVKSLGSAHQNQRDIQYPVIEIKD